MGGFAETRDETIVRLQKEAAEKDAVIKALQEIIVKAMK